MKYKSKSERLRGDFAEGGSDKMFRPQAAGSQKPGTTAHAITAGARAKSAKGGPPTTGRMTSQPSKPGRTGAAAAQKKGR